MPSLSDREASRLAWALVLLYGALAAAGIALAAANGSARDPVFVVSVAVYALVGGLIASRQPRNPIGWLSLRWRSRSALTATSTRCSDW